MGVQLGLLLELAAGDEEGALRRGHEAALRRNGEDGPGRGLVVYVHGPGPPDEELPPAQVREGAGVGVGDPPDQVVVPKGRPRPVQAAVLGPPAPEVGTLAQVEGSALGRARQQARQAAVQDGHGGPLQLGVEAPGRLLEVDGHGLLVHQRPRVGLGDHVVEADAGLRLSVHEDPVDGCPAPVAGQQRAVQVEGSPAGQGQDRLGDHVAEVEGEEEVRRVRGRQGPHRRILHVLRIVDGDALGLGTGGEGIPPDLFPGVVPVGEDRRHLEAVPQEGVEPQAAHGVVAHDEGAGAQGRPSRPPEITLRITNRGLRRTSM